jgi:AraC family transcriptional regulator
MAKMRITGLQGASRSNNVANLAGDPKAVASIVQDELEWRTRPQGLVPSGSAVIVTRWQTLERQTREVNAVTPADSHVIGITLRSTNMRLSAAGQPISDGIAMPGAVLVTAPHVPAQCTFRGPYDVLHLHVRNELIAECAGDAQGNEPARLCSEFHLLQNPVVEKLAHALLDADEMSEPLRTLYAESINIAIVSRLLGSAHGVAPSVQPKAGGLVKWRLKRAVDYIEANLAGPMSLADLASSTGLTRMHFAAQFRVATGLRPHEYLLRRRIERAQELLLNSRMPVVDIAFSVGFQTQSHFTCAFKRIVGQPPSAWRGARECETTQSSSIDARYKIADLKDAA